MRRAVSAVLTAVMLLGCAASLASCGSKEPVKQKVDHVYRVTSIPVGENSRIMRLFSIGEDPYVIMRETETDPETGKTEMWNVIYEVSVQEKSLKPSTFSEYTPANAAPNSLYSTMSVYCKNGSSWNFITSSERDERTQQIRQKNDLVFVDKVGEVIIERDLAELMGEDNADVQQAFGDEERVIFLDYSSNLYKVNAAGERVSKINLNESAGGRFNITCMACEGDLLTFILQSNSGDRPAVYYATVNLKNGKTEKTELPHATFHNVSAYFLGGEYSLYYTDQSFLYGYDVKTKKSTELMDFLNSDCSGSLLDNAQILSPELFVTYGYDEAFGSNVLAIIEQIPKEQVKEKNLITLSVLGDGSSARSDVIRFNRSSDEYRVVIREYNPDKYIPSDGSEYLYSDLIKIVVDEMNNDILSGNAPDLLLVNEFIPLDSYAAKGMLVDLYEFFDADDEIRREDYLMNILQATEINGKLYHIMPSFQVNTYAAKTANMNGMTSWTMEEFIEWTNSLDDGVQVFRDMTRDELLRTFLTYEHDDYIEQETGKCNFDTAAFRLLLEYVASWGEPSALEQQLEGEQQNVWQDYQSNLRNDKAMLDSVTLVSFTNFRNLVNYSFGTEEITFIGLPVAEGNGGTISCDESYAMFKKSNLKEGAWEFISFFLKKEYQDSVNYRFPLRVDSLEAMADRVVQNDEQRAAGRDGRTDQNYVYITREIADMMLDYVRSLNRMASTNLTVINIIREEAGPYFAGQKNLEDTIRIIQNRVSTVVAESR